MLAGVPSGAGQYRFARVIPVLIFPGARSCAGFVLPAKRQVIPRSLKLQTGAIRPSDSITHRDHARCSATNTVSLTRN